MGYFDRSGLLCCHSPPHFPLPQPSSHSSDSIVPRTIVYHRIVAADTLETVVWILPVPARGFSEVLALMFHFRRAGTSDDQ